MGNFVWTRKAEPVWTILEEGVAVRSKKNGKDEVGRLGNGAKAPGMGWFFWRHLRRFMSDVFLPINHCLEPQTTNLKWMEMVKQAFPM